MTVKVYRYISNTKVNVLYHQIPKGLLSKIATIEKTFNKE